MPNLVEHFLFKEQSIAVKKFLQDSLWLTRYPTEQNVGVFYATPERAFIKLIVPIINGGNLYPTISVYLSGMEPAQGQTPGGYFKKFRPSENHENVFEEYAHPLVYQLTYRTTLWTSLQSDMDILLYQAIVAAPQNRKYSTVVDGQWLEIEVKTPTTESTLDPGDARDISFRYGFDIVVPRAYLPLNHEEYYGKILDTDILYDI
jgi:hypothetical protein